MKILYNLLLFLLLFSLKQGHTQASIQLSTGRSFSNFNPSVPQAGSDLSSILSSSSALVNLSITTRGKYQISVRKVDANWDNTLQFYLRRTGIGIGQGNGNGLIKGGTNFIQLSSFDQVFFEGNKNRSSIPIQYEFRNISVLVPAGEHTTTVIYTITSL